MNEIFRVLLKANEEKQTKCYDVFIAQAICDTQNPSSNTAKLLNEPFPKLWSIFNETLYPFLSI